MLKRKHKNIPRDAPTKLWLTRSFDFVVPYTLEEYCDYIETFDAGWFNSYQVYLTSLDQKRIAFNVSKSAARSGTAWAIGYLEVVDCQLTHVVGKAGVLKFDVILPILILSILGCIGVLNEIVSHGLDAGCLTAFFMVLISAIIWISLILTRDDLIDKLSRK